MHGVVLAPVEVPALEQLVGLVPVGSVKTCHLHVKSTWFAVPHVPGNGQRVFEVVSAVVVVVVVVPVADEVGAPLGGDEGVTHARVVLHQAHGDVVAQ